MSAVLWGAVGAAGTVAQVTPGHSAVEPAPAGITVKELANGATVIQIPPGTKVNFASGAGGSIFGDLATGGTKDVVPGFLGTGGGAVAQTPGESNGCCAQVQSLEKVVKEQAALIELLKAALAKCPKENIDG